MADFGTPPMRNFIVPISSRMKTVGVWLIEKWAAKSSRWVMSTSTYKRFPCRYSNCESDLLTPGHWPQYSVENCTRVAFLPNSVTGTPFLLTFSLLRLMDSRVLTRRPLPEKTLKPAPSAIAIANSKPAQIRLVLGNTLKGYLICLCKIGVLRFFTFRLP